MNTIDHLLVIAAKTTLAFVVFVLFLFSAPVYQEIKKVEGSFPFKQKVNVVIGEIPLLVDIADSAEERARGLGRREALSESRGMLFVFDYSDYYGIWMKDMNFPIDIVWINDLNQVIEIRENIFPETYPEVFVPDQKALYVLEVNAGLVKKKGIKIGDQLTLIK